MKPLFTTPLRSVALMLVLGLQSPSSVTNDFPGFPDVATESGLTLMNESGTGLGEYIIEVNGNGAGFFDYDNDGDMDVVIANGSTLEKMKAGGGRMAALYRNDGGRFTDVTDSARLTSQGWGMGVCVADYDNDGDEDFYLTAFGPNILYRNNGDGTFQDVTKESGPGDSHWSMNCAFGDYDRDGYLDLYVANYVTFDDSVPRKGERQSCRYMGVEVLCGPLGLSGEPDTLYHNRGDGTFEDVTKEAGISDPGLFGFGVLFSDLDDDGWPDIFVANDSGPNFLFQNKRDGTFAEVGLVSGTALSGEGRAQACMGVGLGDYDGDGKLDIFVTNFIQDTNTLYRNLGGMIFSAVTQSTGLSQGSQAHLGWGTGFVDLDNDGRLDVFVGNGHVYPGIDTVNSGQSYLQPKELYRNVGSGRFQEITATIGGDMMKSKSTRGVAFGDYDNDGDIDVLAINLRDRPSLYRNDGGNAKHWITIHLRGARDNRDAIGSRIEIESGGRVQVGMVQSGGSYLSNNDIRVHFGLDMEDSVDRIQIRWPDGVVEDFGGARADQILTLVQGSGSAVQAR